MEYRPAIHSINENTHTILNKLISHIELYIVFSIFANKIAHITATYKISEY